jgi:hypothetical protein
MADRREADVVDLGIRAPRSAAGDRDLELPRQVVEVGLAVDQRRRLEHQRRGVDQFAGVEARNGAARDVAGHVAARAHRGHALEPERLKHVGQGFERHPVKLDVLPHRDVGDPAAMALGQVGDRPDLLRLEQAVGNPDSHHEMPHCLAFAALAADRTDAVSLRIDAPPAEVRGEPLGRHRVPALARKALDVGIGFPGIQLALEPLDPLRLGLFHRFAHQEPPENEKAGRGRCPADPPGSCLWFRRRLTRESSLRCTAEAPEPTLYIART